MLGPQVEIVTGYRIEPPSRAETESAPSAVRRARADRTTERNHVSDAVLLPVYNEAATVGAVLDAVREYFAGEIIVVDDGSTDDTPACPRGAQRRRGRAPRPQLRLRLRAQDRLRGRARDRGRRGSSRWTATGSTSRRTSRSSSRRWPRAGTSSRAAATCPSSGSGDPAPPERREINERVTAVVNAASPGWALTDAFCGFKAYRAARRSTASGSTSRGYAMPLELWAKAWRAGSAVREMPVERIYCDHDRSFGAELDDPEARYAYYLDVWNRALEEAR